LPAILSQEEVVQLIDAACPSFHRDVLMTLYATGARCTDGEGGSVSAFMCARSGE